MESNNAVERAKNVLGGLKQLADVAGVSVQQAHQWCTTDEKSWRPVPASKAPLIAAATGIPIEELCPAVPWHLVPQQAAYAGPDRRKQMGG